MKKYIIIAVVGMAFALQTMAQKIFVVHKKDGTRIELPVTSNLHFTGKALVNEDEYTQITDVYVENDVVAGVKPSARITVDKSGLQVNGNIVTTEESGVVYSTTPGVTKENGVKVNHYSGDMFFMDDLDFNTTYYCRSYVVYMGKAYYSSEQSFTTDLPTLQWHFVDIPASLLAEELYVYPTTEAWEALFNKYFAYFATNDSTMRDELLQKQWSRFLTLEKAKEFAKQCSQKIECRDGVIYLLDEIRDDFMETFENMECVMYGTVGLITEEMMGNSHSKTAAPDTIVCSEEYNVPNDTYYLFKGTTPSVNPFARYSIEPLMLANQEYEVEVIMAPETEVEEAQRLPNRIRIQHLNGKVYNSSVEKSNIVERQTDTDAHACTTLTYTIIPEMFGQNAIEIESRVTSSQNDKTHRKALRIAQITVRKVKK